MKFVLLVEGQTEHVAIANFLKKWLDRRLPQRVGVQIRYCHGSGDLVRKIKRLAEDILGAPKSGKVVAVIALLDLYGASLPQFVKRGEECQWLEEKVGQDRFRAFLAVHEVEAWILSQPEVLPRSVQEALPSQLKEPERINSQTPPSKHLDRAYREGTGRGYKKTTYGKILFGKLDPEIAASKCPHLKMMLEAMLSLALGNAS